MFRTVLPSIIGSSILYAQQPNSTADCLLASRQQELFNPLTPNDDFSGRTTPLTSKRSILYIYSTHRGTEYFKHVIYSPFFPL